MAPRDLPPAPPGARRRLGFATAIAVALVVAVGAVGCGADADTATESTAITGGDQIEGQRRDPPLQVGAVTLPEVRPGLPEQPFTTKAQPGNLLFVYFGYTHCPDLCPTTMADLRKALELLGPDAARVETAFVTVDPQRDTAEVLPTYLTSFVAGARALRTEDPDALQVAEDAFLASSTITPLEDGTYSVSHTAFSSIVDETGTVVAEWPFGFAPTSMASDLRILLAQTPTTPSTTVTTAPSTP